MNIEDLKPSWLTTWVAWRNQYTSDPSKPFNELIKEFGTEQLPTSVEYTIRHNGKCPRCKGDGIVQDQELGYIYCICRLLKEIWRINYLAKEYRTEVPEGYLEDIVFPLEMGTRYREDMKKAIKEAQRFIRTPNYWLLFAGRVGIGKTHILKAINTAFYPMALYVSVGALEQKVHETRKNDTMGDLFDALINAPILILDDLGMEHGGDLIRSSIEKIIDARYEKFPDGAVVIATNLEPRYLATYMTRASDRMLDQAKVKMIGIHSDRSFRKLRVEERV